MMFIWYILIGILAGYLAGKIVRGGGMGLLEPDCGNHWWRVGRLAFRHHGNMDDGCYREFDHGDRGGDCFVGDCFVVQ